MLIPHSHREPNQFKIPKWAVSLGLTICVLVAITTVYFIYDFSVKKAELDRLKHVDEVNAIQSEKIGELIEKAQVMEEKMTGIEELDRQVRELVGLAPCEEEEVEVQPQGDIQKPMSQQPDAAILLSMTTRGTVSRGDTVRDPSYSLEVLGLLDNEFAELDIIADVRQENLNILQEEVAEQLKYLAAKPDRWPVVGRITSRFGYRLSPFGTGRREFHDGLDIASAYGASIRAAGDGRVIFSGWTSGYGRMLTISHGYGYVSYYAHNSVNLVKVGDTVKKGDLIARIGTSGRTTGAHVHFMIEYNGKRIDPLTVLK